MPRMSSTASKRLCAGRRGAGPIDGRRFAQVWAASATFLVIARLRATSVATTASPSGRWLNIVWTKIMLGILARVEFKDGQDTGRARGAIESAQFTKERTRFDLRKNKVLLRPMERRP